MHEKSIGLIELTSVAAGFAVADTMLKAGNVRLLLSRSICSGKYMVLIGGGATAAEGFRAHRARRAFSPLTPALSPLRGEGARSRRGVVRGTASAQGSVADCSGCAFTRRVRSRSGVTEHRRATLASPSPLNGERAGVRGETKRAAIALEQFFGDHL